MVWVGNKGGSGCESYDLLKIVPNGPILGAMVFRGLLHLLESKNLL